MTESRSISDPWTEPFGCFITLISIVIAPIIGIVLIAYFEKQPTSGPASVPEQTFMERIWALEDAPVGTLVTFGGDDIGVVCTRRTDHVLRTVLDIRENLYACNVSSLKEERTAWGWVIHAHGRLDRVSGVALPCEHPLREAVINDELRNQVPECT
ncbi:MAG: hypothetical protein WBK28_02560 [Minisyncoccia bacterium]